MVRLGGDCSGYNSAGLALEALHVKYEDVFTSEVDKKVRQVLKRNFPDLKSGKNIQHDCTTRDPKTTPECDLYTAGFPCQPYSTQGAKKGSRDSRSKAIIRAILAYITEKLPRAFCLENVSGLVDEHREFFDWVLKRLKEIQDGYYEVIWSFVDTKLSGIPQSRKRVLIVGISQKHKVHNFEWPEAVEMSDLEEFLDPVDKKQLKNPCLPTAEYQLRNYVTLLEKIKERSDGVWKRTNPWVGDLQASETFGPLLMHNMVPCITRARAGGGGFYLFNRGRTVLPTILFQKFLSELNRKFGQIAHQKTRHVSFR